MATQGPRGAEGTEEAKHDRDDGSPLSMSDFWLRLEQLCNCFQRDFTKLLSRAEETDTRVKAAFSLSAICNVVNATTLGMAPTQHWCYSEKLHSVMSQADEEAFAFSTQVLRDLQSSMSMVQPVAGGERPSRRTSHTAGWIRLNLRGC
eukprot:359498-Chlamydomonas_euryale.AAC.9